MGDFPLAFSDTAAIWEDQAALARFRRALRRGDQHALDDLLKATPSWTGWNFLCELLAEFPLLLALLEEQRDLADIHGGLQEETSLQIGDG